MSMAEIEAELDRLSTDELRRLAMKSWEAFVTKEGGHNECVEDDPALLKALDEAIAEADSGKQRSYTADEVRARLKQWTSK